MLDRIDILKRGLCSGGRVGLSYVLSLLFYASSFATPGPDSTLLLVNLQSDESLQIADHYQAARLAHVSV